MIGALVLILLLGLLGLFFYNLQPAASAAKNSAQTVFEVKQGDGFRTITQHLYDEHLIRSRLAFEAFALLDGKASSLKPGLYRLNPTMNAMDIAKLLTGMSAGEARVAIPEGSNIYEIDKLLSNALVIHPGDLINFHDDGNLEGKLFPDTYEFFTDANIKNVAQELLDNFVAKAVPVLSGDQKNSTRDLIIASLLEKEVPDQGDQEIVAGIILKRLAAGMPLNIDATICYAKLLNAAKTASSAPSGCYPLTPLDFKIDSPYNTYLYKGLPPSPIGNPGISAITAALSPQSSPYWYYLSDPKTGKTIFAKTLDEQNKNKFKYLESN